MSIQASLGRGSLLALGMGVSDVATVVSLGMRVGNWLTTASGDKGFLELLDQDEMDILKRRGLIDVARFNKRWGEKMALLVHNEPKVVSGQQAEKALQKFGRFTAIMVSTVAALDAFASPDIVKLTLRSVLAELLRTTEYGEDIFFPVQKPCKFLEIISRNPRPQYRG